jgi:hypothetical protein
MGIVPGVYDVHGWHPFEPDLHWNGPYWCAKCDCLIDDHIPLEAYKKRETEFVASATHYREVDAQERRR